MHDVEAGACFPLFLSVTQAALGDVITHNAAAGGRGRARTACAACDAFTSLSWRVAAT